MTQVNFRIEEDVKNNQVRLFVNYICTFQRKQSYLLTRNVPKIRAFLYAVIK